MSSGKASDLMARFGANIAGAVSQRPGQAGPPAMPTAAGPDRYAGAVKSRAFAELPLASIVAADQPRTDFDAEDLARLAESIRRYGQLAPIRVRFDEPLGAWVVLVGERRLRACRLAGMERIRVELVEREMSPADVLAEQVVENAVRADLQPVEQARAFRRLMDLNGWNAQQLAETLNVEPTSVYRCLALLKLPEDVAARVDTGEIKATAAYEISKLQFADDQREAAGMVVAEGLDHKATVVEVNRRRAARKPSKGRGAVARSKRPTVRVVRTAAAKVTVEFRRAATGAEVAAALREAADRIEGVAAGGQAAA